MILAERTNSSAYFDEDIDLQGLLALLDPESDLVPGDDMMLADADGTILKVSSSCEQHFGFPPESIVGRSAFALESSGVFAPCVIADVIRQKRRLTAAQTINHIYSGVMTVGIPLFGDSGELKYAVSFTARAAEQPAPQPAQAGQSAADSLVFQSDAMQRLWTLMHNTADTKANILITGETGVGKSAIAKTIHSMSSRAAGPFVEVNCAVLHENLIESELFGYEKGAFTGAAASGKIGKIELANHGTLFLDEIGELPPHIQSKLLQLIQEKTIERLSGTRKIELDFRLIVATNRNLEEDVQLGLFRSDLFYRLNVIRIHIPPLRSRREDILPLARRFLDRFNREYHKALRFSDGFLSFLEDFSWPGNVRQLENLIERLVITVQSPVLDISVLPGEYLAGDRPAMTVSLPTTGTLTERMEAYERQIIRESYRRCGTTVAVARDLGISQATAARKVAKYVSGRRRGPQSKDS